jgi:rusticyanin
MDTSNAAVAEFIGKQAGKRLAGNAPLTVTAAQARTLGNQTPTGAKLDRCANDITFTSTTVSVVVEASPPDSPDMTFRIAGLTNPTLVVPTGARVTVEFINADSDEAHGWTVTTAAPPYGLGATSPAAFPGAQAGVIGNPTNAGQGARTITFTATTAGTYHYLCPVPGHAQVGMTGTFIVTP